MPPSAATLDGWIEKVRRCEHLRESELKQLCDMVRDILMEESNVQPVNAPVTICGDVHGQFFDVCELFEKGGQVPHTSYIFMGDFVDRGHHSVETLQLLLCLKVRYPANITLLRGNHECRQVTQVYGFYDECFRKYGSANAWKYCTEVFDYFALAAVIDSSVLCVHGGLSPHIVTLDQIRLVERNQEIPHDGPFCDLMWSDPEDIEDWAMSQRGAGWLFGGKVTSQFNFINNLELICRAHQLVQEGYKYMFPDKNLITVWSAPNYCLAAGSRVALGNQTSVAIESIATDNATSVFSYSTESNSCVVKSTLGPHLMNQGVKECIELVMENGSSIICTPDHRIITTVGEIMAGDLLVGHRVIAAAEGPLVPCITAEAWTLTYTLEVNAVSTTVSLNTSLASDYSRAMAFARVLGYMSAHSSIRLGGNESIAQGSLLVGHALDVQSIIQDIKLVLNSTEDIAYTSPNSTSNLYSICVPVNLARVMAQFGLTTDNKLNKSSITLPTIVTQTDTPLEFIREYLGGLFGSVGSAPIANDSTDDWTAIQYSAFVESSAVSTALETLNTELVQLLDVLGVTGIRVRPCDNSAFGISQIIVEIPSSSTLAFTENVGFRHSVQKQQCLGVAAGWYRGVVSRREQQERLVNLAKSKHSSVGGEWTTAYVSAMQELKQTEVLLSGVSDLSVDSSIDNPANLYKSIKSYIHDIGASTIFSSEKPILGENLPAWNLSVAGIRNVGMRPTYDISVADTHLFVANGLVVHNCYRCGNIASILVFDEKMDREIKIFTDVPESGQVSSQKSGVQYFY